MSLATVWTGCCPDAMSKVLGAGAPPWSKIPLSIKYFVANYFQVIGSTESKRHHKSWVRQFIMLSHGSWFDHRFWLPKGEVKSSWQLSQRVYPIHLEAPAWWPSPQHQPQLRSVQLLAGWSAEEWVLSGKSAGWSWLTQCRTNNFSTSTYLDHFLRCQVVAQSWFELLFCQLTPFRNQQNFTYIYHLRAWLSWLKHQNSR